jgi:hypothetical protein
MRASLAAPRRAAEPAAPLLDPRGARVVLGAQPGAALAPVVPTAASLFGPRGACLAAEDGPLFVCDTGHHRLLVWNRAPQRDATAADFVIGQPAFSSEGRGLLAVPTGVAASDGVLAVADAWNDRVLLWHRLPRGADALPDVALDGLKWPYGVALHEGRLYVADTGNRRVLVWHSIPRSNRSPDAVLAEGMRWPHALAASGARIFIADAGAASIAGAEEETAGTALDMPYGVTVLAGRLVVADSAASRIVAFDLGTRGARYLAGQPTLADRGENRWGKVARDSLSWPYGVAGCGRTLVIADSGNNRVLLWDLA